jgi:hypothetical protein
MRHPILTIAASCLLAGSGAAWYFLSHRPDSRSDHASAPEDRPIAPSQVELLDLAFRAASAIPVDPHVKDRSKAQEVVLSAALELGQPARALRYVDRISNWRRGAGYGSIGLWCAQHGAAAEARRCLEVASRMAAEEGKDGDSQEWRRDRIRAIVARVHALLGEEARAAEFGVGLSESEVEQLDIGGRIDPAGFDACMVSVDEAVKTGNFDRIQNGLKICARLFDRFYADPARRAEAEGRVRNSYEKLPPALRVSLIAQIADTALEHSDRGRALDLVNAAQAVFDSGRWLPQDRIPMMARLGALRFRAGDVDRAKGDLAAAVVLFESAAPNIVDIERARTLRPVAEAYQTMGDRLSAMKAYAIVVEDGVKNPNSRPRAEDLSATCVSMALHAFEPDPTLRARIIRLCDELREPW